MRFRDRVEAGQILADRLTGYAGRGDVIVLALPRGGIPVAAEVARALGAPLDVCLVRKLGVPGHEELAMGALAEGGTAVLNDDVVMGLGIPRDVIDRSVLREQDELERRALLYRGTRPAPNVTGRTVILVDDGLATGATTEAAVVALRSAGPARIVVAVPVGARESVQRLAAVADEVVCPAQPEPFDAVGLWYDDFTQTSDEEVKELLQGRAANEGR
jgi:putative phosphoribosyl transferase